MSKAQKFDVLKIILSAGFLIAGAAADITWLFIAAYIIAGYRALFDAVSGIIHGQFLDENFLMAIASLGAIYCGEFPEAVAVMLFNLIGEFFEHYAVNRSRKSIADLMDIKAEFARKIVDGEEIITEPEELKVDDIILIRPGEKIPVDGIVVEGASSVNTAALTGEAVPSEIAAGSSVISGTVNLTGALRIRVTSIYENSTVAKVLDLVENASDRKAPVEKFITRFARYYTPAVVGTALVLAVVPPVIFGFEVFSHWLYIAMIFLVVSCPCALVISVPLSLFAGIGSASRHGILVKGGNYLETLAQVKTMVFDKTGTLTTGNFSVTGIFPADGVTESELLETAAYGESLSNHPIARAIQTSYGHADSSLIDNYREIAGRGISAVYNGKKIYCGNFRLMDDLGLDIIPSDSDGSVVHVSSGSRYLGYITADDTLRPNTKSTLAELKSTGIQNMIMLTGDREAIAEAIAEKAGISRVYADLLPEDKVNALERLLNADRKSRVAFVGDGVNDAPVLARSDVGIAMGALGSDAAIEAADIVILNDDISYLTSAVKIAKKTLSISKANVIFALAVKFGVLILSLFGLANMWLAVFADVGVTFIAILNSMRALKL